jgi:hypothetical protein
MIISFLKVQHKREATVAAALRRIDFIGNAILTASVTSILLSLTYGGTVYAWSSWRSIVPLILGLSGLIGFQVFESSKYCLDPTLPIRIFQNRTTSIALALTFIHGIILYWTIYFLPLYFQSVRQVSPLRSSSSSSLLWWF